MISVSNVSKVYSQPTGGFSFFSKPNVNAKEVRALEDVNLEVPEGQFLALLGPNGAGKSTLIKILIGVLAPTAGEVRVLGVNPLIDRSRIVSRLGIVFGQRSRLWYDLPVSQSLELTKRLYIRGYPNRIPRTMQILHETAFDYKKWFEFLIDSIDIGHLLPRQVKKLSLGEKMRCELVNTLLYNPDLIFLDEPTIGLDIISKTKIREALKILHRSGKTIVLTSHDTGDIGNLCERVVIVNHGSIALDSSIGDFLKLETTTKLQDTTSSSLMRDVENLKTILPFAAFETRSDYQLIIELPKERLSELVPVLFQRLEIIDMEFDNPDVEKTLARLYVR